MDSQCPTNPGGKKSGTLSLQVVVRGSPGAGGSTGLSALPVLVVAPISPWGEKLSKEKSTPGFEGGTMGNGNALISTSEERTKPGGQKTLLPQLKGPLTEELSHPSRDGERVHHHVIEKKISFGARQKLTYFRGAQSTGASICSEAAARRTKAASRT